MPVRFTSARFVGREAAFTRLAALLDDAASGRARALLIGGIGGIGVSRLLDEAVTRIALLPEPMTVLRGRATTSGFDEPYMPVLRALRPALVSLDDDELGTVIGPAAEDAVRLMPELGPRLAFSGRLPAHPTIALPERRQARIFEGLLGILGRLGERRPVVLLIEDLQHADAATRSLVTFLVGLARWQRLAIVATHQPDELTRSHPWTAALGAMLRAPRPPERLELPPLDRDALARLIQGIEGERPSASVLLLVTERSAGSPLVAEELLAARRELSSVSLTSSLEDLVLARAAIRSPECRRVLRLIAPARQPIDRAALARIAAAFELGSVRQPPRSISAPRRGTSVLDADLTAGLAEAIEHAFLLDTDGQIAFRHELVGAAVETDLLPFVRGRHHAALAVALDDQPVAAAHHWLVAHDVGQARAAAIRAAAAAAAVHAPADELVALELALALSETGASGRPGRPRGASGDAPEADHRTDLRVRAAEAAFAAGRAVRAAAFAEAAIGGLDGRRDRVRLGLLHERLGHYRRAAGDASGALAARRRSVELVPRGDTPERAMVLAGFAQFRMLEGTFSDAERLAREAIRVARACGPAARAQEAHATTTLGVTLGWGRDPEEAIELLRESHRIATELGDIDELFRVYANLTTVLDLVGRRTEAIEVAYEGLAQARAAGLEAVYGNFLRGNAADSLFLLGRWAEARALSATALEWLPVGVNFLASVVNLATVEIETNAGELAGRLLGQTLLELEAVRDSQLAVPFYLASASFALWRGDVADARRAAERGWELVRATEDWVLAARMAAASVEVDAALAAEARERRDLSVVADVRQRSAVTIAEAQAVVTSHGVALTTGSRRVADAYLATARAQHGRIDGADDPRAWAALADCWRELGAPYEVARARWREAGARLASGGGRSGRLEAREPLLDALGIGLELGARPLVRELRELAGRALITVPPEVGLLLDAPGPSTGAAVVGAPTPSSPSSSSADRSVIVRGGGDDDASADASTDTFGLSRREREVLGLLAQGRTNREIGERLFISQKTVGVHVGNILAKLGVSGRVEAAAVAIRLELVERR